MAIYHLNNQSYDISLGLDLKVAQIGHTVIVKTKVKYFVMGEELVFPIGKYKIVDFVHSIEHASWLEPNRVSKVNVYLEEDA